MSCGTCKTCQHWSKEERSGDDAWACPCRVCESPHTIGDIITPSTAVANAYLEHILTGPDFGCVHYKEKS